jgi:TPR repeat protein
MWSPNLNKSIEIKGVWKISADATKLEGSWNSGGSGYVGDGRWNLTKVEGPANQQENVMATKTTNQSEPANTAAKTTKDEERKRLQADIDQLAAEMNKLEEEKRKFEEEKKKQANAQLALVKEMVEAENGNAKTQMKLGDRFLSGDGVEQDYAEAFGWYSKAANQGVALAQLYVGNMYLEGQGVSKNNRKAVEWLGKAAKQGNEEAKDKILEAQYKLSLENRQNEKMASKKAEEERIAAEKKRIEEKRRAEARAKAKAQAEAHAKAIAVKKAEEERIAAEQRRMDEKRKAEEERIEAEIRKGNEKRLAEKRRKIEEEQRAAWNTVKRTKVNSIISLTEYRYWEFEDWSPTSELFVLRTFALSHSNNLKPGKRKNQKVHLSILCGNNIRVPAFSFGWDNRSLVPRSNLEVQIDDHVEVITKSGVMKNTLNDQLNSFFIHEHYPESYLRSMFIKMLNGQFLTVKTKSSGQTVWAKFSLDGMTKVSTKFREECGLTKKRTKKASNLKNFNENKIDNLKGTNLIRCNQVLDCSNQSAVVSAMRTAWLKLRKSSNPAAQIYGDACYDGMKTLKDLPLFVFEQSLVPSQILACNAGLSEL